MYRFLFSDEIVDLVDCILVNDDFASPRSNVGWIYCWLSRIQGGGDILVLGG
jgi:hypothetical protein